MGGKKESQGANGSKASGGRGAVIGEGEGGRSRLIRSLLTNGKGGTGTQLLLKAQPGQSPEALAGDGGGGSSHLSKAAFSRCVGGDTGRGAGQCSEGAFGCHKGRKSMCPPWGEGEGKGMKQEDDSTVLPGCGGRGTQFTCSQALLGSAAAEFSPLFLLSL